MCGIVAYVGPRTAVPVLMDGLKRLEYRGYDSAGIAALEGGEIRVHRRAGKLRELEESLRTETFTGTIGLGHTRWATHGRPNEVNAHPQGDFSGQVVVVHNGIVRKPPRIAPPAARSGIPIRVGNGHRGHTAADRAASAGRAGFARSGAKVAAGASGRLRDRGYVGRGCRHPRGGASREPAGRRNRRGRSVRRIRRTRPAPLYPPGHGDRGRRNRAADPGWRGGGDQWGRRVNQQDRARNLLEPGACGKGRFQPFHAKGDFRAAAGARGHDQGPLFRENPAGFI